MFIKKSSSFIIIALTLIMNFSGCIEKSNTIQEEESTPAKVFPSTSPTPIPTISVTTAISTAITPVNTPTKTPNTMTYVIDKKIMERNETWDLEGGLSLRVAVIDGASVWLFLFQNGKELDDKVVNDGEKYIYKDIFSTNIFQVNSKGNGELILTNTTYKISK